MRRLAFMMVCLAFVVPTLVAAGKVYQYKDANGNLVFSDQPPSGQKVEPRDIKTNSIQTSGGGYALREAAKKNPVVLWATVSCGTACDQARALLQARGIPYAGRNPETNKENLTEFKRIAGESFVPVLQVGDVVHKGFLESAWSASLDAAGYPKTADPTVKNAPPDGSASKPQVSAKPR